jgi:hypothetical protein
MSLQRYINSSFWSDDWVDSLSVKEKLIYMYLLTNENTNIAGVYRITIKRIKDDTGIPKKDVEATLKKFADDKKAFYIDEYIIIPKWPKHQKLGERGTLRLAVIATLKALPEEIKNFIIQPGNYDYDTAFLNPAGYTPSIPHTENDENPDGVSPKDDTPSSDLDSDLDLDSDHKITDIGAIAQNENNLTDPKKLFLYFWQHTPDVFNSTARIESPKDFDHFWETSNTTCDQVKIGLNNFILDARSGAIEPRYIPSMPDRFVLKGWILKCQKRFRKEPKTAPPPSTSPSRPGKKSL